MHVVQILGLMVLLALTAFLATKRSNYFFEQAEDLDDERAKARQEGTAHIHSLGAYVAKTKRARNATRFWRTTAVVCVILIILGIIISTLMTVLGSLL